MGSFGLIMAQVYMIKNKINNKAYIGITKRNFYIRYNHTNKWWENHHNIILKNSVKKHGSVNFEVIILEETDDLTQLNELEINYIKKFNSLCPNGYNLQTGGNVNFEVTQFTKEKISKSKKGKPSPHKGKKANPESIQKALETKLKNGIKAWNKGKKTGPMKKEHIENSAKAHKKQILCFDLSNNLVKQYDGAIDAKKDGFNPAIISRVCKGFLKTHKNHIFKYKEKYNE